MVLSLTCLYWVVTGVHFWFTDYAITFLEEDPTSVYICFAAISITGPTSGIVIGNKVIKKLGNSKKAV